MDVLESSLSHRPRHIEAEEWAVRVDLAACYRLIAHFGWDDLIFTHISARVPGADNHFLINPMGLSFREITASNLLKIDVDGRLVEPSEYEPIFAGFVIHSAIHMARHDARCVLHTHTAANIGVGALEVGLLPLSQWAMRFYERVAYHDYEGPSHELDERERLQRDIGDKQVLVLRNHGLLTTGRNVAEAFSLTYYFQRAAEAQLKIHAAAIGAGSNVIQPSAETCRQAVGRMTNPDGTPRLAGQREWPALLRLVDSIDPTYRN